MAKKKSSRSSPAKKAAKTAQNNSAKLEQVQNNMIMTSVVLGVLILISLGLNLKVSGQIGDLQETFSEGVVVPTQQGGGNGGGDAPQPSAAPTVEVSADDDPVKGEADAPIEVIEFSDFQCPFCKRFFDDTLPQIQEQYIDTGKVKLVYRDLPLNQLHPQAQKAAEAAECADDQGKFWEYHDLLFERQSQFSDSNFKAWADELGLNTGTFDQCLDSGKHADEVNKDLSDAQAAGASGTPTFFINGKKLVGAHPFSTFQQAFEAELN